MYLTYAEYQAMGGTLDETAFNDFEFESECIINWYTFDRLKNEPVLPTEVKKCMNALIKLAKLKADSMVLGSQTEQTTTLSFPPPRDWPQQASGFPLSWRNKSCRTVAEHAWSKTWAAATCSA